MYTETLSLWQYLSGIEAAETDLGITEPINFPPKPIIIYGMGNGADKILAVMERRGLSPAGFMASDEFVRGRSFRGFDVKKLEDIQKEYKNFIILVAFGTNRPDVMEKIYNLSEKYEVYVPDVPVYGDLDVIFNENYAAENAQKIASVREIFADEKSKDVFDKLIDYRLSGKLEPLRDSVSPREEAVKLLGLKSNGSEVFMDFGAYDGDTAQEFAEITGGNYDKIYAFEPDFRSFCKLRRRHYLLTPVKLEAINAAVWNKDGEESFTNAGGRQSSLGKGKPVKTIKADSFCESRKIKPTFMKFDVEGCEAGALAGAETIIKKYKPKLEISLYHRTEDLFDLPQAVRKLNPKYKLYLRRHDYIPAWDINLYCI